MADNIRRLDHFVSDDRLRGLEDLFESQRSEFDALDFVGGLRLESGRALWGWEEFHSGVLAWLLDPKQSHGISDRFLSGFLTRVEVHPAENVIDWSTASVQREWPNEVDGEWGYLDVLILNEADQTLCAVENKVFSSEHSEQLTRYRKALADSYPGFTRHHVFLTPRGKLPDRKEEHEHWTPATYAAILNIIQGLVDDNRSPAKEDVRSFLRQYVTTLRRNIVPETSITQLARQIYLQHRAAIELINQYKPDFAEETKTILREAIAQHPSLRFDLESSNIIRVRSVNWDEYPSYRTGTAWKPSESVLTLEFDFRQEHPFLLLMLGPGSNQVVRTRIYQSVIQYPHLFKPVSQSLVGFTWLDRKGPILNDADFDNWDDQDAIRSKVNSWVDDFAENQFPAMNAVIVSCLREYEAEAKG